MTTLQEYLSILHPNKESKEKVKEICFYKKIEEVNGGELDLSDFPNVEQISLNNFDLTKLTLKNCANLKELNCSSNDLVCADFLNDLPNPEKLERLIIYGNNIEPTDIAIFNRFVNLRSLKIGNLIHERIKHNRFYGSFQSLKNLTGLYSICIEATDVDSGLEFLPFILAWMTAEEAKKDKEKGGYMYIECSPHNTNAKCKIIQDQLRPYNYDLEAWQLAHPAKMYKAKPEIFFNPEIKTKWLTALRDKTNKTQQKLTENKEKEPQAVKRIKRLETKLDNLKLIQENISNHTLIERLLIKKEMVNKETQTEIIRVNK
jgi:hypothetical protein